MTALALSFVTFISTALGGAFALRQRRNLNLVMAFAAGVLVAAALLDLFPEALDTVASSPGGSADTVFLGAAAGFLVFYALERFVHLTAAGHEDHSHFGAVAALGLTIHSFLDGFAIGAAFRANPTVGLIVAIAVISHDFADGVSTVAVVLASRGGLRASISWLAADALAPVVGAAAALYIALPEASLGTVLGFFAGSFLFVGASHLLPESHLEKRSAALPAAVACGFAFLYVATHLLQG
jgi:ZIP family zinc transporter